MALIDKLKAIGNAVRGKTGGTALLTLDEMAGAIANLEVGGGGGETPTITVSDTGLITATAGGEPATKQLSTQSGTTVTPGASRKQAVAKGKFTTGTVYVGAIPSNYVVPEGNLSITENGEYDVTDKESVTVSVTSGGGGGGVKYLSVNGTEIISCNTFVAVEIEGAYARSQSFPDTTFGFVMFVDISGKKIFFNDTPPYNTSGAEDFSSGTYTFNDQAGGYLKMTYSGSNLAFTITDSSKCELDYIRGMYA